MKYSFLLFCCSLQFLFAQNNSLHEIHSCGYKVIPSIKTKEIHLQPPLSERNAAFIQRLEASYNIYEGLTIRLREERSPYFLAGCYQLYARKIRGKPCLPQKAVTQLLPIMGGIPPEMAYPPRNMSLTRY